MQEILYSSYASSIIKAVLLAKISGQMFLKNKAVMNDSLFCNQQIDVDKISSTYIYDNYKNHYGEIHWFANSNFHYFKRQINLVFRHRKDDKYPLLEKVVQDSINQSLEFILAKCTNEGRKFYSYYNQVNIDIHANKGFSRMQPVENKTLIGNIQTEHHTGDIILNFFIKRFPGYKISLIDQKKDLAFIYDLKEMYITKSSLLQEQYHQVKTDDIYERYWRQYYATQYIPEKKNLKLALKNFPKKYWTDTFEVDFLKEHLE